MDHQDYRVLLMGDLADPWVEQISRAVPGSAVARPLGGSWPDFWPRAARDARVVIVHRAILTHRDHDAFLALKSRPGASAKLILIVGPHIRAVDLERWATSADVILPEATASRTITRHVAGGWPRPESHTRIGVVAALFETRRLLGDCLVAGACVPSLHEDWSEVPPDQIVVWDVPLLDPLWESTLTRESANRRVVCLMGFADRDLVGRAERAGAAACLDLPFDPTDLHHVLGSIARFDPVILKPDAAHEVPPAPRIARPQRLPLSVRSSDS